MYAREYNNRKLTFDFAMGLLNDNLLFVDRETGSVWSQLENKAIIGPMKDEPLSVIPSLQTTWKHWLSLHPETRVLTIDGEAGRPYLYRNRKPGTPRPENQPDTHDTSVLGLGLVINGEPAYFPFAQLDKASASFEYQLGGKKITVRYEKDAMTAWAEDETGTLLPGVLAYRFGWLDFHPDSRIFVAQ